MRVGRLIEWVAGFYPTWDHKFVDEFVDVLRLSKKTKVKALSKGQNSSLALLLALGHRQDRGTQGQRAKVHFHARIRGGCRAYSGRSGCNPVKQ